MVELMPFKNRTDFQNYISRLQQIPTAVDQTISVMKRGLSFKILPPKVTLEKIPEQINRQTEINIEDSPFYQPFIDMSIILDSTFQDSIKLLGESIIKDDIFPAYQNLKLFFEKEYYPNARDNIAISSIPNGTEYYKYLVKYHTTTDKTPIEIHQIGLDEVKRIRIEMDKIIKELIPPYDPDAYAYSPETLWGHRILLGWPQRFSQLMVRTDRRSEKHHLRR